MDNEEKEDKKRILDGMDRHANFLFYNTENLDEYSVRACMYLVLFLYREYRRNPQSKTEAIEKTTATKGTDLNWNQADIVEATRVNDENKIKKKNGEFVTHENMWNIYSHLIGITIGIMALFTAFTLAAVGWMLNNSKPEQPVSVQGQTSQGSISLDEHGNYTENKTHSHSPASISPKRDDKSQVRHVSK